MADTKLSDLTEATVLTSDDLLYGVDDPAGTPASVAIPVPVLQNAAGLLHATLTANGNQTLVVGVMHTGTIAGYTADRTATLPAVAAVGDRCGILLTAGDDAYELLVTAASGDTLNGVAGGTEWSRLFITGEMLIFRCVSANATWVVERDGRIAMHARLVTGNISVTAALNRLTSANWGSPVVNRGDGWITSGTNPVFKCRRVNEYDFRCSAISGIVTTVDRQFGCMVEIAPNGAQTLLLDSRMGIGAASLRAYPQLANYLTAALDDEYGPVYYHTDSASSTFQASTGFRFAARELF